MLNNNQHGPEKTGAQETAVTGLGARKSTGCRSGLCGLMGNGSSDCSSLLGYALAALVLSGVLQGSSGCFGGSCSRTGKK